MIKTSEEVQELIAEKLTKYFATVPNKASTEQMYKATALVVRDILLKKKQENNQRIQQGKLKRVYYLCMEFLIGRSLKNNLYNLGLEAAFKDALKGYGYNLDNLYEARRPRPPFPRPGSSSTS